MSLQREDFPLPDVLWDPTREYWQAASREELCIPQCNGCQRWVWYPKPTCPACGQSDFTWKQLSGRARLFSWVVVRHAFLPQYRDLTPFLPALVVPVEAPHVRLTTRMVQCTIEDLEMDMPVRVTFEPLQFPGVDASVMAPLFRPEG